MVHILCMKRSFEIGRLLRELRLMLGHFVGMGSRIVACEHGIVATLAFGFFLDGKKLRVWLAWFSLFC